MDQVTITLTQEEYDLIHDMVKSEIKLFNLEIAYNYKKKKHERLKVLKSLQDKLIE